MVFTVSLRQFLQRCHPRVRIPKLFVTTTGLPVVVENLRKDCRVSKIFRDTGCSLNIVFLFQNFSSSPSLSSTWLLVVAQKKITSQKEWLSTRIVLRTLSVSCSHVSEGRGGSELWKKHNFDWTHCISWFTFLYIRMSIIINIPRECGTG